MADLRELNEALFVLTDRIHELVMGGPDQQIIDMRLVSYLDYVDQAHIASEEIHVEIEDSTDPIWDVDE